MRLDVFTYDELPYTTSPMPYAQPQHLATLGTLFGISPPPVATSRVLELGCNDGKNIIATAYSLPQAECWGVDMSAAHITHAQQVAGEIGLKNLTLKQINILQLDEKIGKFDYIIAHGIYSWVSRAEQDKILQICKELLTINGVAYVSYSTRPGWDNRTSIRDMLIHYTSAFDSAEHRIEYMQQLLNSCIKPQTIRTHIPFYSARTTGIN
ncbi:MAG: class I SAM-dependent methyltransferase [Thiotrichaceae bacterium]